MILQLIAAFFATMTLTLLFNAPKKELFFCGLNGVLSWFLYLVFTDYTGSIITATLIAASGATTLSRILARVRKVPITLFLVGGIIPLVPGSGIYDTMYSMVNGSLEQSLIFGVTTLKIAASIGLGITVALSIPNRWFEVFKREKSI